jgi:hypothetical protein
MSKKETKGAAPKKVPKRKEMAKSQKSKANAMEALLEKTIERNLAGFVKPFTCIGTEEGGFTSVNGRKGKFAYVVKDAKGDTFKVGLTQLKQLGIDLPKKPAKEPQAAVINAGKGEKGKRTDLSPEFLRSSTPTSVEGFLPT